MGEFDVTDVIDGIKEFCSDVVEKVVNFFKGLFSNEEQQDVVLCQDLVQVKMRNFFPF